jgi:hypothetical protein
MSDPNRQPPNDSAPRGGRPHAEDPLEELARILGETGGQPVRPENFGEVGRRATPTLPMPQQLSALEAELFDELRSSVTPESRVRGSFEREVVTVRPQQPADDHDIAALRIDPAPPEAAPHPAATRPAPAGTPGGVPPETPWNEYYAYDDGVAAGSYDPAFAGNVAPIPAPVPAGPRPTFDDYGRAEIGRAAAESEPFVAQGPIVRPNLDLPRGGRPRRGLLGKLVVSLVALGVIGGGAWAGWKYLPGLTSSGPTLIRADGKPLKTQPDPTQRTAAEPRPSLTPDSANGASKIVSLQEEPVDQVSGRTPEGKEVRVINPGVQRPASDQPHTVKTVIVRPDGTIVSDGAAQRGPTTVRTQTFGRDGLPVAGEAGAPVASAVPPTAPPVQLQLPPTTPAAPAAALPPVAEAPASRPIDVPLPVAAPRNQPTAAPIAAAPTAAAPTAPALVPTRPTPPVAAAPAPTAAARPATGGAPLSLGPTPPRLASATPAPAAAPAAPVAIAPAPAAPAAASAGSGDWMVQISATKSDADARRSFADAQRRWPVLAGRGLDVQQANLGDRGTFYRARVSGGSREQAVALCEQLKAQGGQCMVVHR